MKELLGKAWTSLKDPDVFQRFVWGANILLIALFFVFGWTPVYAFGTFNMVLLYRKYADSKFKYVAAAFAALFGVLFLIEAVMWVVRMVQMF